jgi:hypothetical protein
MLRLLVLVDHRAAVAHPVVRELERPALLELEHPAVLELERPVVLELEGAQGLEQVPGQEPALAQEAAAQR